MGDSLPALCAGGILLAIAFGSAWFQWRYRRPPVDAPAEDLLHARRQLRRRLQVSLLLAIVAVLIPLGDMLPFFRRSPLAFVIYWCGVLGLAVWIGLLALGDLASAQTYHRTAAARLRQQQRELQDQIDRYRAGNNGHPTAGDA